MGITIYNASAGSGKTYLLTNLIADFIKGEKADRNINGNPLHPQRFIATTFTKDAAKEIKERAAKELLKQNLIPQAYQLNNSCIGTVNAVCGSLLEKYVMYIGISSNLRVIDEDEATVIMKEISGSCISHEDILLAKKIGCYEKYNAIKEEFEILWFKEIEKLVNKLRTNNIISKEQFEEHDKLVNDYLEKLYPLTAFNNNETLEKVINDANLFINQMKVHYDDYIITEGGFNNLGKNDIKFFLELCEYLAKKNNHSIEFSEIFYLLKTEKRGSADFKKKKYGSTNNYNLLADELSLRISQNSGARNVIVSFIKKTYQLSFEILKKYQEYKAEKGLLDFTDQEHLLLEIIRENKFVRDDIKLSYDILFVDEFQDTSPIQLAIFLELSKLVKYSFWVGDPKQAIYEFREADPYLMLQIIKAVEENKSWQSPIKQKDNDLDTSYRSRKEIVELTNHWFEDSFDFLKREHICLKYDQKRPIVEGQAPALHFWQGELQKDNKTSLMANFVASKIKKTLDAKNLLFIPKDEKTPKLIVAGDIAVLCKTNDQVKNIAKALMDTGIKANAKSEGLLAETEVALILAMMKYVNNPFDTLAKSELLLLANFKGNISTLIMDKQKSVSNENWQENSFIIKLLADKDHKLNIRSLSLSGQFEALISITNYFAWIQYLGNTSQRRANVLELQTKITEFEKACANKGSLGGIYQLESWLNKLELSKGSAIDSESVNVMTIHKSKGLEFPMVVLFGLESRDKDNHFGVKVLPAEKFNINDPLANRLIHFAIKFGGEDLANEEIANQFNEKVNEEIKRLMYVAVTRTRDFLMIPVRENNNETLKLLNIATGNKINSAKAIALQNGQSIMELDDKTIAIEKTSENIPTQFDVMPVNDGAKEVKIKEWALTATSTNKYVLGSGDKKIFPTKLFTEFNAMSLENRLSFKYDHIGENTEDEIGNCMHAIFYLVNMNNFNDKAHQTLINFNMLNLFNSIESYKNCFNELKKFIENTYGKILTIHQEQHFNFSTNKQQLSGIIDLLFETEKGWVIVDYKSHFNTTTDLLNKTQDNYTTQLNNYAFAINNYKGKAVIGALIYYPILGQVNFATTINTSNNNTLITEEQITSA